MERGANLGRSRSGTWRAKGRSPRRSGAGVRGPGSRTGSAPRLCGGLATPQTYFLTDTKLRGRREAAAGPCRPQAQPPAAPVAPAGEKARGSPSPDPPPPRTPRFPHPRTGPGPSAPHSPQPRRGAGTVRGLADRRTPPTCDQSGVEPSPQCGAASLLPRTRGASKNTARRFWLAAARPGGGALRGGAGRGEEGRGTERRGGARRGGEERGGGAWRAA